MNPMATKDLITIGKEKLQKMNLVAVRIRKKKRVEKEKIAIHDLLSRN